MILTGIQAGRAFLVQGLLNRGRVTLVCSAHDEEHNQAVGRHEVLLDDEFRVFHEHAVFITVAEILVGDDRAGSQDFAADLNIDGGG